MADIREVSVDELRHLVSERAQHGETMLLNMGPQHPSTHGVLRLLLELDGEIVVNCIPDIGFLHTGVEKNMEAKTYQKAEVMTDRLDYLNPLGNNLVYCLAVEKLCEMDVPARAQVMRVILAELVRINSHLVWLGTSAWTWRRCRCSCTTMREREIILDIFELISGARMMTTYIRPGGLWRDVPVEFESGSAQLPGNYARRIDEYEDLLTENELFLDRTTGHWRDHCRAVPRSGGSPGRSCAQPGWRMICARQFLIRVTSSMILISPPIPDGDILCPLHGAGRGNAPVGADYRAGNEQAADGPGAQQ